MKKALKGFLKKVLGEELVAKIKKSREAFYPRPVYFDGIHGAFSDIKEYTNYNVGDSLDLNFNRIKNKHDLMIKDPSYVVSAYAQSGIKNLFPLLAATLMGPERVINVLDFGGGFGESYIDLQGQTTGGKIVYHVVDLPEYKEKLKITPLYPDPGSFHFHISLEGIDRSSFDIILLGSVIEFIENYADFVQKLKPFNAKYIFITNTLVMDDQVKTFVTTELNVPGKKLRYRIFNYNELIKCFDLQGYRLIYRSSNYDPDLNFDNFPLEYRNFRYANLLFVNINKG